MTDSHIDDADVFLLGIEADHAFGLALEWADEQEGNAAYLEHVGDVAVLIDIDAVEIHLAVVVLGNLSQDGLKALARLAPVGIEVHHNGPRIAHDPIHRAVVGDNLLELLLSDGMNRIDRVGIDFLTLGPSP